MYFLLLFLFDILHCFCCIDGFVWQAALVGTTVLVCLIWMRNAEGLKIR